MTDRDKRVLWLINHTTLRQFEVPMLRGFGLEVYTPKKFPAEPGNRSASVTFEFDGDLTIPKKDLQTLNSFNFYTDEPTPTIRRIINEQFGSAIVAYMFPMLDNMISQYKGRILLRAFGLTSDWNYYDYARSVSSPGFRRRISRVGERFWFAQAYPNLKEIEPEFLQKRTLSLPLGLPERIAKKSDTWVGGDKRLLFVCPDIRTYPDSAAVYEGFKKHFGHLPHVICGAQTKPIKDDPAVLGYATAEEYDRLFRECAAMFYHSRLPRHLHYHPVEAICYGMPLIFMKQGMLGNLGGADLPGASNTIEEARKKVERLIVANDTGFREEVQLRQKTLLQWFSTENNVSLWQANFLSEALRRPLPRPSAVRRIAVLALDESNRSRGAAMRLAWVMTRSASATGVNLQCMVGLPGATRQWYSRRDNPTVLPRKMDWIRSMGHRDVRIAQRMMGNRLPIRQSCFCIPEDGSSQFMECESWLLVGDNAPLQPAPIKPHALFVLPISPGQNNQDRPKAEAYGEILLSARAVISTDSRALDEVCRGYGLRQEMTVDISKNGESTMLDGSALWQTMNELA